MRLGTSPRNLKKTPSTTVFLCPIRQRVAAYALHVQKRNRIWFNDCYGNVTNKPERPPKVGLEQSLDVFLVQAQDRLLYASKE